MGKGVGEGVWEGAIATIPRETGRHRGRGSGGREGDNSFIFIFTRTLRIVD